MRLTIVVRRDLADWVLTMNKLLRKRGKIIGEKKTSRYDDYMTNMILGVFFRIFLTVGLMATNRGFGRVNTIFPTIRILYVFSDLQRWQR